MATGKDFPFTFGMYMKDRYVFAQDVVRFAGEQVAAVIARDARTAKRAAAHHAATESGAVAENQGAARTLTVTLKT